MMKKKKIIKKKKSDKRKEESTKKKKKENEKQNINSTPDNTCNTTPYLFTPNPLPPLNTKKHSQKIWK